VCKERHLLHTVFHVLGRCTSKALFSFLVYNIYSLDLSMAIDEDDLISDGKLFHKNTILLKYEFRKREVLHRFGRRSPELERVGGA
jgi:hypothetical protein